MAFRPKILMLESVSKSAFELLEEHADLIISPDPKNGLEYVKNQKINGIITRGKGKVDKDLLNHCDSLKVVARCGVGLDNIDVSYATTKGIKVINAPGSNASTVAEHTLALMLMVQRKLPLLIKDVKMDKWSSRSAYNGDEIRKKKLGIIGMGDIGRQVADLASAFGMEVSYWNRSPVSSNHRMTSLEEILNDSDIISIHLLLNDETRGLLKALSFQNNSNKPILINTSRGGIIKDDEILKALKAGYLSAFAADVLEHQPPDTNSELLNMENVYVTPHAASLTATTFDEMCRLTVTNALELLYGRPINEKYIFNYQDLTS